MRVVSMFAVALVTLVMPLAAAEVELVVNGDFEDELAGGWESRLEGPDAEIIRDTTIHPDPDCEVRLLKGSDTGLAALSQRIVLPSLDTEFRALLYPHADANLDSWAAAGLLLRYAGEDGEVLGQTAIVVTTRHCPWADSGTMHIIAPAGDLWQTFCFNLAAEIANLSAVDPDHVRSLEVMLLAQVEGC